MFDLVYAVSGFGMMVLGAALAWGLLAAKEALLAVSGQLNK